MKLNSNFFSRLFKRAQKLEGEKYWWTAPTTSTGKVVNQDAAMRISAVYGAVKAISETLGVCPLILYRRKEGGGKERAVDHPLYYLLHDMPSEMQTSQEMREMMQVHTVMTGNSYAQIIRNNAGTVAELMPLDQSRVEPQLIQSETGNRVVYEYSGGSGPARTFRADQVLHIKGLGNNLLKGMSVIDYARECFGQALTQEEFASRYFANAATPSGVVEYPGRMGEVAVNQLKKSFEASYSGAINSGRIIALEAGVKFQPIKLTNEQSQFIQLREFSVVDIVRWFRIPPHMVGDLTRATFSNIEHLSLEFVMFCMLPWFKRWESRLNHSLLTVAERKNYYFEFLIDGLVRGDLKTRNESYALGRQGGWLSVDEIREFENMSPLPDGKGKIYLEPLNMKPAGENQQGTDNGKPNQDANQQQV